MCDCFHLAFPNWHAASSGTGPGRRLQGPEPSTGDNSVCDEPAQFTEERPRPQGSSPVEEFPETEKFDSDKECEHDPCQKGGIGKKPKKSGLGSMFEKRSTPKMSKLKELPSPESGVIVKTAKDGNAEGLIYGGGGKEGLFIKEVVPESPASKNLKLKEGDQVLSATVYFDNVPYEDAIQILEHAQAYRMKLCLKRKPEIIKTEPAMETELIPEEECGVLEMREPGKTKRRGDARISWPKFPSFGKGRRSRFTRSHSTSEADEQRKLELSPTTSDTESPIKSQDVLKGKKRHKVKLPALTKRGRISSSEEQDSDLPTTGPTSGDIHQTVADMLSPECLGSPEEDLKVVEEFILEQNYQKETEPQIVQHKVELISIGSSLKTEDTTAALADQGSPCKSPKEKKSKKDRSQLKIKILGKERSHKKDTKAKGSPKRLKTLGASIEKAEQNGAEKSDTIKVTESHAELQGDNLALDANTQISDSESSMARTLTTQMDISIPTIELDFSDVPFMRKSPQKEQAKMEDIKSKQETKTAFKLPKLGFSDIETEETIHGANVKECPTKSKKLLYEDTTVKRDPYDQLSERTHTRAQLPKREDIEIPGMEDMSVKAKTKGIKVPKVALSGHYDEIKSETVQMLIDVDSVKEAVSKLPGYKLPKVDTSGMPIPEEITVIDANAQRISVKTPTKVSSTKSKHEMHLTKNDMPIAETNVHIKPHRRETDLKKEVYKREEIIIPGTESKQKTEKTQDAIGTTFESQSTAMPTLYKSNERSTKSKTKSDAKISGIESIEYIDSTSDCLVKSGQVLLDISLINLKGSKTAFGLSRKEEDTIAPQTKAEYNVLDNKKEAHLSNLQTKGEPKEKEAIFKMPKLGFELPKYKGPEISKCTTMEDHNTTAPKIKAKVTLPKTPEVVGDVSIAEQSWKSAKVEVKAMEMMLDEQESKVKIPSLGITMPKMETPRLESSSPTQPDDPEVNVTLTSGDRSIPEQKMKLDTCELEMESTQFEVEHDLEDGLDKRGSKFKIPKFGIKMPKIKGPEFDLSLSRKDDDVTLPEGKVEVTLPDVPDVDVSFGKVDFSVPKQELDVEKPDLEIKALETDANLDGQGSKFKMPKFGIKMPKIKGPEIDFSMSSKSDGVTLPEAEAEVILLDVPDVDVSVEKVDLSVPKQELKVDKPDLEIKPLEVDVELHGQGSKFKMPKFGIKMPKMKGPELDFSLSEKDMGSTLPEVTADIKLAEAPEVKGTPGSVGVSISEQKVEIEKPDLEIEPPHTEFEHDEHRTKFKMPKFGIKMPKLKAPEMDLSWSKKDVDITLIETKAEVKLPEAPEVDVTLKNVDVSLPEQKIIVIQPEVEPKSLETKVEIDGQGSKFKMPKFGIKMPKMKGPELDFSLSRKDDDVTLPGAEAEITLPEVPDVDVSLGKVEFSVPEQKLEVEKPDLEIKPLETDVKLDGQGSKMKMPKFGFKMPKMKGPELDFSLSRKDDGITLPGAEAEVTLPEVPDVDVSLGKVEFSVPEQKLEVEKPDLDIKPPETDVEVDVKGSRFKMPKFGIKMPKMKGPELDFSLSRNDDDVTLPGAEAEITLPEVPDVDVSLGKVEFSVPEQKLEVEKPDLDIKPPETDVEVDVKGSRFKMPKFGIKMPKMKGPELDFSLSRKDDDVTLPGAEAEITLPEVPDVDVSLGKVEFSVPEQKLEVEKPDLEIKPLETDVKLDGQGSKMKMPKFGFKMPKMKGPELDFSLSRKDDGITLPGAEAEVTLPEVPDVDVSLGKVEFSVPEQKLEVEKPDLDIKPPETDVEVDVRGSRFKMPKFGIKMPKMKGPELDFSLSRKDDDVTLPGAEAEITLPEVPDVDVSLGKVEFSVPEQKLEVEKPDLEIKPLETDVKLDGQGSKMKMPKFGFKMPKMKGPELDFSLSRKDDEITLPGAKAEITLPEVPDVDVSLGKVEFSVPEQKLEVEKPDLDIKPPETDVEVDVKGSRFKMPKFGIKMPKMKGPELDFSLSRKDDDVTLPGAEAEITLPEVPDVDVSLGKVEFSVPEQKLEVEKPDLEIKPLETDVKLDGQGSKMKMPKFGFKMPKMKGPELDFSLSRKDDEITLPGAEAEITLPEVPDVDVSLGKVEFSVPEQKLEVEKPDLDIKPPETDVEVDVKGSRFKMPKFGIKMPKMKGPELDFSLSRNDDDVTLPGAEAEITLPEVPDVDVSLGKVEFSVPEQKLEVEKPDLDIKSPETDVEVDVKGSRFKMPKFGIKMPKMKGPELDFSLSRKDDDVTLPGAEAEITLPEVPDVDVSLGKVEFSVPEQKLEVEKPDLEIKPLETDVKLDGQGSKMKMPKFGFKMPKMKGPELDFSLSRKDDEITLPGAKAEITLPEVPDVDVSLGKVEFSVPEQKLEVEKPDLDIKPPETDVEVDVKGSRFKMPKFGIKMPKMKGPELDFSLSRKDDDVTLPGAEAEITLPEVPDVDVSLGKVEFSVPEQKLEVEKPDLEIKPLETDVRLDGQGSKMKMPKFGFKMPKMKGPELDFSLSRKDDEITLPGAEAEITLPEVPDVDVSLGKVEFSVPEQKLEVEKPDLEIKPLETDVKLDGQGSKMKMPKFGFKMPKMKGPELDFSLSRKDDGITLPGAEAEVTLPEVPDVDVSLGKVEFSVPEQKLEVEKPDLDIKPPETDVEVDVKGSRFKMPKFGIKMPKMKGPELDFSLSRNDDDVTLPGAEAEITLPEVPDVDVSLGKVEFSVPEQKLEVEKPDLDIKPPETDVEVDVKGSRFKMPKFGIKMPKMKGPELDFSLSRKDDDVTLPGAEAEITLPEVPDVDVSLGKVEFSVPEQKLEVEKPDLEIKPLETDVKLDGQRSKMKMPKFGFKMPKMKGPEWDSSLPKKDVDVTLTETKAEVKLPEALDVDVTLHSVDVSIPEHELVVIKPEVEIKPVDIKAEVDGQRSKFKMPKFGIKMPKIKGPELDLSLSRKDGDVTLPEAEAEITLQDVPDVDISLVPKQKLEVEQSDVEIKLHETDNDFDGQGPKFKMPKFGIKMPKLKGPDVDLSISRKDIDVTLPEAKAEVPDAPKVDVTHGSVDLTLPKAEAEIDFPDVELKEPPANVDIKVPGIETQTGSTKESPSKFKLPSFKFPKFGVALSNASAEAPDVGEGLKVEANVPEISGVDVSLGKADAKMEIEKPEAELKQLQLESELDDKGIKFKMPRIAMSMPKVKGPEIDFSRSNKDAEIKLPEGEAEVDLPNVELKESSDKVDVKVPEIKAQMSSVKGSPSKFKLPTFKFPTFGIGTPDAHAEKPDGKDMEVGGQITGEFDVNPEMASVSILGESELCEEERKVKMAEVGMSLPKLKGPEMNISMSKKDAEVKLKEAEETSAKVEMKEIEDTKGSLKESPSKFKFPTFKFPKFGVAVPSVSTEVPSVDKDVEVEVKVPELPDIDVNLGITEVLVQEAQKPENEIKPLQQEGELDNQEGKLMVSLPKINEEGEIKLQVKEVQLKTEVKSPDIDAQIGSVKGSPSKLKLPTFKFPKFGIATPNVSAEVQGAYKYGKSDNEEMNMPKNVTEGDIAVQSIDIKRSSIDLKTSEPKSDGKGSKFKVPKFGLSLPKVQGPKIDLTVSHKDVKVNLPDVEAKDDLQEIPDIDVHLGKAEVIIPEAKIEIQKPQVKLKPLKSHGKIDGQGGSMSIKDAHIKIPEAEAEVSLSDVELKGPTAKMEVTAPEIGVQSESLKGSPSKFKIPTFKLPKFGMGTPTVSAEVPDIEEDINVETKIAEVPGIDAQLGTDVTITETREEIQKPDVEIKPLQPEVELGGQSSKLKKSRFSLPKISRSKPSVKATEVDVSLCDVTAALPDTDTQLEGEVDMTHPEQEAGVDGQEIKFKMPKIGVTMEEVKGPQIDISLSKNDGELTKQDVTAEVKPTKAPSAETEMTPKIKVVTKKKEGSPSKFKMPTFKLPKFGDGSPKSTAEIPTEINEADINNPEEVLAIEIAASSIAKKGIDDTIPEVKVDVQIPGAEKEQASSPLRFKMPTFTLPKFGGAATSVNVEIPDVEQEIKVTVEDMNITGTKTEGKHPDLETNQPVISMSEPEAEADDAKLKKTSWTLPKFSFSKTSVKGPEVNIDPDMPEVDVTQPTDGHSTDPKESQEVTLEVEPATDVDIKLKKQKFSFPKFSFSKQSSKELDVEVSVPEGNVEVITPEATVKTPESDVQIQEQSKFKMPKFGISVPKGPDIDINLSKKDTDVTVPKAEIEARVPELALEPSEGSARIDEKGSKFKMPRFGITMPKVKSTEIDLSKKDTDVTIPEVKAEVQLTEVKQPTAKVEIGKASKLEGSPSKLKMPTITLPKFASTKVSMQISDVNSDVKIDSAKVDESEVEPTVGIVDAEGPSVELKTKEGEIEGSESRFRMPRFGISVPKVKSPEIDLGMTSKTTDPLPGVDIKESETSGLVQDASTAETEAKSKRQNWSFPKFSFSKTGGKVDVDVDTETPKDNITSADVKAEVRSPNVDIKGPSLPTEEPIYAEVDASFKKSKFSLPKISFSKSSAAAPESVEVPQVEVSLLEGEVKVKQPEMKTKTPEVDVNTSRTDANITLPDVKAEVKLPEIEFKESSASIDTEAKSKGVGGSPLKFKMPTFKMPKFGGTTYEVTVEASDAEKIETDAAKSEVETTGKTKGPSVDVKSDTTQDATLEEQPADSDSAGHDSPSRFKLPSFKMPKLGFSRTKPEETVPADHEGKENQPEPGGEGKSQVTLTSFNDILENIDVKIDVSKPGKVEEDLETSDLSGTQPESNEKDTDAKQDATRSPEKTGWFKFPRFGLSSPSEPVKTPEIDKHWAEKSPVGEMGVEETSPSLSVQSSDAFADVSSTMTSEHVGLSLSSPTKVTVKYSDPDGASGSEEIHSKVVTSTTKTELISVEPNLPEKITILSSAASSSSEDTLQLKSGKIHIITSNIQATPEAHHAKLLTAIQVQPTSNFPLQSEAGEAMSWTAEESQGGKRMVFEKHFYQETSSQKCESKETVVITKQIRQISGETATSIQRLKDSVHSEKMRFFDGAKK